MYVPYRELIHIENNFWLFVKSNPGMCCSTACTFSRLVETILDSDSDDDGGQQ